MIAVLYHKNCKDGFTSAWAAWKKLRTKGVKYIPVSYGDPAPNLDPFKKVYILDFSYSKEEILKMREDREVIVIDHHKTAQKELEGLEGTIFDMNKSGAMLSWEYFHPTEEIPNLVKYVQDWDLWRKELPNCEEIITFINCAPKDFTSWDELESKTTYNLAEVIDSGKSMLKLMDSQINSAASKAERRAIFGHKGIPVVNCTENISMVCHKMLKNLPDATFAVSYTITSSKVKFSLRSRNEKENEGWINFDVSLVAKQYNGGGHRNAAGITLPLEEGLCLLMEK